MSKESTKNILGVKVKCDWRKLKHNIRAKVSRLLVKGIIIFIMIISLYQSMIYSGKNDSIMESGYSWGAKGYGIIALFLAIIFIVGGICLFMFNDWLRKIDNGKTEFLDDMKNN